MQLLTSKDRASQIILNQIQQRTEGGVYIFSSSNLLGQGVSVFHVNSLLNCSIALTCHNKDHLQQRRCTLNHD